MSDSSRPRRDTFSRDNQLQFSKSGYARRAVKSQSETWIPCRARNPFRSLGQKEMAVGGRQTRQVKVESPRYGCISILAGWSGHRPGPRLTSAGQAVAGQVLLSFMFSEGPNLR